MKLVKIVSLLGLLAMTFVLIYGFVVGDFRWCVALIGGSQEHG